MEAAKVKLAIYDVRGRRVDVLADEIQQRGRYVISWNGTDRRGSSVASGVYFVSLDVQGERYRQKMALVR